jgi:type IV pilus assembly protein PilF
MRPSAIPRALLPFAALAVAACVTSGPKSPIPPADLKEAARINTQLGVAYMQEGEQKVAKEKLDRAIQQNPDYAPAHGALAMLYSQRGDVEEAEKEYRRALRLDNQSPELKNNFGVFLCGQGRREEAIEYFMQAAQDFSYSTPEAAWTNAGVCVLQHGGNAADAEKDFREALRVNPNFPAALLQMGTLSANRGDYLEARAFLQRYERSGPMTADILALRSRVERELGDTGAARDYQVQLLQKFPDSPQAQALRKDTTP